MTEEIACRNKTGKADPDLCSKYCSDHPITLPCDHCKEPMVTYYAGLEVIGAYHSGCFGYPLCSCATKHTGECEPSKVAP